MILLVWIGSRGAFSGCGYSNPRPGATGESFYIGIKYRAIKEKQKKTVKTTQHTRTPLTGRKLIKTKTTKQGSLSRQQTVQNTLSSQKYKHEAEIRTAKQDSITSASILPHRKLIVVIVPSLAPKASCSASSAYQPGSPTEPHAMNTYPPPAPVPGRPGSQHTTQQLPCFLAAWRIASLRRSTSTTSTVVSSLSRPNLPGVCSEVIGGGTQARIHRGAKERHASPSQGERPFGRRC
jgi:hypothetical protein